ncbi:MAG: GNAT family N-acetyltransferase [Fimbriimonadaceae bacterium]
MAEIRPINPNSPEEINLVAERMRLTLMEVVNDDEGSKMYSMEWLVDRVRFHLDPTQCDGAIFLAVEGEAIVGHTIVRIESGEGYFSTFYVVPEARRQSIASEFVRVGEAWMRDRGMTAARTNTAKDNTKLQNLLFGFGYKIDVKSDTMVSLTRQIGSKP